MRNKLRYLLWALLLLVPFLVNASDLDDKVEALAVEIASKVLQAKINLNGGGICTPETFADFKSYMKKILERIVKLDKAENIHQDIANAFIKGFQKQLKNISSHEDCTQSWKDIGKFIGGVVGKVAFCNGHTVEK